MTAGSPLVARQPFRPSGVRAARVETTAVRVAPPVLPHVAPADDDEFRMNLSDLPRLSTGLHVDGFAPSLTSRILDLFDRIRGR